MIPLGVPVNMIGDAITDGMVDAITFGWDSLTTTKNKDGKTLNEQVSVLIDANFAAPAMMVVMNKATWDALPPDLQAVIEKNSADLASDNARLRDQAELATRARLKVDPRYSYIALNAEQHAEMERRIQPAVADWKQSMARIGIDGGRLYARGQGTGAAKQRGGALIVMHGHQASLSNPSRGRRSSIRSRLFLAFGTIAGTTVVASVAAWLSLSANWRIAGRCCAGQHPGCH